MAVGNLTGRLFHGAVREHLLSAQRFLLQSPKALFLLLRLLGHLVLPNLLGALVQHLLLLLLVEALEVVGLYTVGRKHRLLRGRVLSHKVGRGSVGDLVKTGLLALTEVSGITVTLLARQLAVRIRIVHLHFMAKSSVLFLGFLQETVVMSVQFMSFLLCFSRSFLSLVFLFDLLFDPVFLL